MRWIRRLLNTVRTRRLNREIDRELAFHIAERADALKSAGLSEAEALREARRRLGNPMLQRERTRDADVVSWVDSFFRDLRHALRGLVRAPVFASVAVLSLALGIGANTAVFSLIEAVVLRPLPVPDPEELVAVGMGGESNQVPYFTNPVWEQVRDRQSVLSAVAAFSEERFNTVQGGESRRLSGLYVSGDYFRLFGVEPVAGRVLGPSDDVRGCARTAVLSHGLWQREYGTADVVGRSLTLEGMPFEILGVSRPGFGGPEVGREAEVYVPLCAEAAVRGERSGLDQRSMWWLRIMGRRAPGVALTQVNAELAAIAPAVYAETVPDQWSPEGQKEYRERELSAVDASTGLSGLRERYGDALVMLMAGVGLVLLIACANVANLLLARGTARERELAIRSAIGAGRARLGRQMITESLLLAALGAAAGVAAAGFSARALVRLIETQRDPVTLDVSLNPRVLVFTMAVAVLTVLVFGLIPAWRAGRVDPQTTMSSHGRGIAEGQHRFTLGKALVVGQVALSLVLLAGAGLLVGSLRNLTTLDPGFTAEGLLVADAELSQAKLGEEGVRPVADRVVERLRSIPGVRSASASALTPLGGRQWNDVLVVDGFTAENEMDALAWFNEVSPGYLETMDTRLLTGRDFNARDVAGAQRVAIVTESVARKFYRGAALGKTFRNPIGGELSDPFLIVGVVQDMKYSSLREETSHTVLLSATQAEAGPPSMSFEIRTEGSPAASIPAVRQVLADVNPAITVEFTTLADQLARSLQRERMLAVLSGIFAGIALALAMLGLYGIMAYTVARRRNEIGVRIALGADRGRVLRMVLRDSGLMAGAGIVLGTVGAVLSGRLVATFLYGLSAAEPAVIGGAAAVLALVALTAGAIPAWRAARLNPTAALRED
jgi:putative ABC transport system permease protein